MALSSASAANSVVVSPTCGGVASWMSSGTIWPISAFNESAPTVLQHLLLLLSIRPNVTFNEGATVFKLA